MTSLTPSFIAHRTQCDQLFSVLEQCKRMVTYNEEIPNDEKLFIRKLVYSGKQEIIDILKHKSNKKMQMRLKKCLHKYKQAQRKSQEVNGKVHNAQQQLLKCGETNNNENQCRRKVMMKNLVEFKRKINGMRIKTVGHSLNHSKNQLPQLREGLNTCNRIIASSGQVMLKRVEITHRTSRVSRVCTPNKDANAKVRPTKSQENKTHISSFSHRQVSQEQKPKEPVPNTVKSLVSSFESFNPPKSEARPVSDLSLISTKNCSYMKEDPSYVLKSQLIKYYAEEIFELVVKKYFPLQKSDRSIYLPYRKLLEELNGFAGGQLDTTGIAILPPFTSEFEGVTINILGSFLEQYCLRRSNEIRNLFTVFGSSEGRGENVISMERFERINAWKGKELIDSFISLVKKWGEVSYSGVLTGQISYWQVTRCRQSKEFIEFMNCYRATNGEK